MYSVLRYQDKENHKQKHRWMHRILANSKQNSSATRWWRLSVFGLLHKKFRNAKKETDEKKWWEILAVWGVECVPMTHRDSSLLPQESGQLVLAEQPQAPITTTTTPAYCLQRLLFLWCQHGWGPGSENDRFRIPWCCEHRHVASASWTASIEEFRWWHCTYSTVPSNKLLQLQHHLFNQLYTQESQGQAHVVIDNISQVKPKSRKDAMYCKRICKKCH